MAAEARLESVTTAAREAAAAAAAELSRVKDALDVNGRELIDAKARIAPVPYIV